MPPTEPTSRSCDEGRIAAEREHLSCERCAKRRAATRLGLTICIVCAGLIPEAVSTGGSET